LTARRSLAVADFAAELANFGVRSVEDLADVTDADLTRMGMRELQRRRFLAKSS
jgi:hypothetical protein